jgi:anti-sigma factor RsiW
MKTETAAAYHLTEETLHSLAGGRLTAEETIAVTEHLASCPACTRRFAQIVGKHPAAAPAGFEEEVIRRAAQEKTKRAELLHFSFRVAAAACAAVFLIFVGGIESAAGSRLPLDKIQTPSFSAVNDISTHLRDFSQKILDMEVFRNVETEK